MNSPLTSPRIFVILVHLAVHISGMRKLRMAICNDDAETVKKLLDGRLKEQILHGILDNRTSGIVNELVMMLPPRNVPMWLKGDSALHLAVMKKAPKVTRLLLEYGANVNIANLECRTPLHLAVREWKCAEDSAVSCPNHASIVEGGVGNGGKVEKGNVVDVLLEYKADVHWEDYLYCTPLTWAVTFDNAPVVRELLHHGANVNDRDLIRGQSPLFIAVNNGFTEMAEILLENGAKVSASADIVGKNVMHLILDRVEWRWLSTRGLKGTKRQTHMAKLLLRSSPDEMEEILRAKDRYSVTPMDVLFEQDEPNREIMVEILKILSSLDGQYASTALRVFSRPLELKSSAWPLDSFQKYVKTAINFYMGAPSGFQLFKIFHRRSSETELTYFIENDVYSLYVILRSRFLFPRHGREEAAQDTEKFDQFLRVRSLVFQSALVDAFAKDSTLEILPAPILTDIFQRAHLARNIERLARIMALVQFTRDVPEMELANLAPKFLQYVGRKDILL